MLILKFSETQKNLALNQVGSSPKFCNSTFTTIDDIEAPPAENVKAKNVRLY